jgi:hypothetical protein
MRGNWGAAEGVPANSHGNFRHLLKCIRVMEQLRNGEKPSPTALRSSARANPDWFEEGGKSLSPQGKEILERVIKLIPASVSRDGLEYLKRRKCS